MSCKRVSNSLQLLHTHPKFVSNRTQVQVAVSNFATSQSLVVRILPKGLHIPPSSELLGLRAIRQPFFRVFQDALQEFFQRPEVHLGTVGSLNVGG